MAPRLSSEVVLQLFRPKLRPSHGHVTLFKILQALPNFEADETRHFKFCIQVDYGK